MPFNKMDVFNSVDAYKKELKKELGRLDATLGDFFFYDDFPVNGTNESLLVVGQVKPPILKALKSGAKAHAEGKCFVEGSTLKLTLTKGKMLEAKLRPVFKGTLFDFKMVSSGPDAADDGAVRDENKARNRLKAATARFDKAKGHLAGDERIELLNLFGKVIVTMKAGDWATSFKALESLDAKMIGFIRAKKDKPTGVSQSVKWNKVTITYSEADGKRVMENREKLAQTLVSEVSRTQQSGGGSSWASPVLEKEAVDRAMAVGHKLMGYTHYATGNTSGAGMVATNFTSLTVVLDQPTSGLGWGYAVTRKGAVVEPGVATAVLKKFEQGDISLDRLFRDLNVELIEKPNKGGVLMVPRCKVILTRATETDDWKLKTHYPDHKLELKHEGWQCERGQPKGDVTLRQGDVLKVFDNKVLP